MFHLGYKGLVIRIFMLLAATALASQPSNSQQREANPAQYHGRKSVVARATSEAIAVDGVLSEADWNKAQPSSGLTQKEPREGEASTETTEIRVLYSPTTLYIGVLCADSSPSGIIASERRRDGDLTGDDTITLVLDTYHDHRSAFLFRTNALGTQYDALVSDEGKTENINWDERWQVATSRSERGWTAEFAIPFKSLRVEDSEGALTWGMDLERVIRRKNEIAIWNDYRRGFSLDNMSQAGHLRGLEGIQSGLRLRVKPFVLGGFSQARNRIRSTPSSTEFRTDTENASDGGLEDVKLRVTPSLTADFTVNTDFAQADVDSLQVNLDRYPLFFPEKREFFQESSGIFDIGTASRGTTSSLRLFHSRAIGLSPRERRPVPIVAGGRVTGKLQGMTLGLLNVQTEQFHSARENIPASNYSVIRMKRDILARSSVGGFMMNREKSGSGDFNRIYGSDAIFTFKRHFTMDGFFAKSDEARRKSTWAYSANARWDSDFFLLGLEYLSMDPGFRDDMGFVRRTDLHRLGPSIAFRPRPNITWIRQLEFSGTWDYQMDASNSVSRRVDKYAIQVMFQDGGFIRIIPFDYEFDRVERPFEIAPGVIVPKDHYQWNVYVLRYQSSSKRRLFSNVDYSHRYGFYKGNMYKIQLDEVLKLNEKFSLNAGHEIDIASLPGGEFNQYVVNFGANYALNNRLLTSTTIQYDKLAHFTGVHFRLDYIFRPGDDFFLIYDEGREVGGPFRGQRNRSLQAKLTYSFDF